MDIISLLVSESILCCNINKQQYFIIFADTPADTAAAAAASLAPAAVAPAPARLLQTCPTPSRQIRPRLRYLRCPQRSGRARPSTAYTPSGGARRSVGAGETTNVVYRRKRCYHTYFREMVKNSTPLWRSPMRRRTLLPVNTEPNTLQWGGKQSLCVLWC